MTFEKGEPSTRPGNHDPHVLPLDRSQFSKSKFSAFVDFKMEVCIEGNNKVTETHEQESKNKRLTVEELGEKDGKQINKILTDRLNRQRDTDMELVLVKQLPMREDLQRISQQRQEIVKDFDLETDEAKQKLLELARELETTLKAREDSGIPSTNMDHVVNNLDLYFQKNFLEALKKQLSSNIGNGRSPSSPP